MLWKSCSKFSSQVLGGIRKISSIGSLNYCNKFSQNRKHNFEEVRIKVPFGHLAGKWWGSKDVQPIVAIHGWRDNAGTFDRLIPLLPENLSFLCIDMPGSGFSSKLPPGASYHALDSLYYIDLIRNELKLDKVSLMAHSFGSIQSFLYSTIFPDKVNLVIGIDALKALVFDTAIEIFLLEDLAANRIRADQYMDEDSNAFTKEQLYKKLNHGLESLTGGGITPEAGICLLPRMIRESKKHPGKFYISKDSRDKYSFVTFLQQNVSVELASRLNMPYLVIKARQSPYYDGQENFDQVIEVMKKNPKFAMEFVDGTHHVHLNDPEKVAPAISRFLAEHWKPIPMK